MATCPGWPTAIPRPCQPVALEDVPDPRRRRGVRHGLVPVLAAAACAVLAGTRSYLAIAEWAADCPASLLAGLG